MKTTQKNMTKKASYVVGTQLPDNLTKKARDFLVSAMTPIRALDIAAKVTNIAVKNCPADNVKRAC
jgi:hypothetical protein